MTHPVRSRVALASLALVTCLPAVAWAQGNPTTLVVTGAREALPTDRLAGDLVVIDRERIRDSAADSIEDLLRREAGLQLSRSGPPGANAGLLIRGASSGQTLVMIDGVRIGAATSGLPELEALSLDMVERVEVLRGPGSSLYGADAVGGVVQIVTRRGSGSPQATLQAAAGGYGARQGSLQAQGAWGPIDAAASLGSERNTGVSALRPGDRFGNHNPDADGFQRRSAQLQLGWAPAAGHRLALHALSTRLDSRYDASEFLPPTFAQDASGDFRSRTELDALTLRHEGRWGADWRSRLSLSTQRSDLATGATQIDRFRSDRRLAEAQLSYTGWAGQTLTVALSRLHEAVQSTAYAAEASRDTDALALAWAGSLGPASLQLEWRHDDDSSYGRVDTGRAGLGWALGGGWRARAVAGSTFRAPSFNDLVYPGYGVPTLGPERGRSAELGLDWRAGPHQASFTVYRNRVRDLIGYEPDRSFCPPGFAYDFGCARNVGRARLQGASVSGGTRLGAWSLRGSLELLDAKDLATGARLTRRAAHQATLSADWQQGPWRLGAELVELGARPEGGRMLAAATTLDLKARWALSNELSLEARLLNATDRDVEPALDYRSLGRQAWLGARWTLR